MLSYIASQQARIIIFLKIIIAFQDYFHSVFQTLIESIKLNVISLLTFPSFNIVFIKIIVNNTDCCIMNKIVAR